MKNYLDEIYFITGGKAKHVPSIIMFVSFSSILDLLGIGLIGPYLSLLIDGKNNESTINAFLSFVGLNDVSKYQIILFFGILLIGIFLLKMISSIAINKKILKFTWGNYASLKSELMESYQNMGYLEYTSFNSSKYIHAMTILVSEFCKDVLQNILRIVSSGIIAFFIIIMLGYINFVALLVVILLIISFSFLFDLIFKKKSILYGELSNDYAIQSTKAMKEGIEGLKEIRVLGIEEFFHNKVDDSTKNYSQNFIKKSVINSFPPLFIEFLLITFLVVVIIISSGINSDINSTIPIIGVFSIAALRLKPLASQIMQGVNQLRLSRDSTRRLYLDLKNIKINRNNYSLYDLEDKSNQNFVFKKIIFNNVSFKYPDTSSSVLDKLSLEINFGEAIGLIGKSGSGKTTLVDTIIGLLKPDKGEIIINDGNHDSISSRQWMDQIAYLPQQTFLIDSTLKENIAFGIKKKKINEKLVIESMNYARLNDLMDSLPNGMNSIIGEMGIKLSGGQKQRIALARAFYHNRQLLIMDESTSSLDNETEKEIVEQIKLYKGKKTIIVIAHRISTLEYCDRILMLKNGKIDRELQYSEIKNKT